MVSVPFLSPAARCCFCESQTAERTFSRLGAGEGSRLHETKRKRSAAKGRKLGYPAAHPQGLDLENVPASGKHKPKNQRAAAIMKSRHSS
ncbi:hypothetical protein IJ00_26490 (plasmid) [Calothrix sp. 336/3]|nr:hypothetical protein IJ00_26490 [Calothrix sp. 336/3]